MLFINDKADSNDIFTVDDMQLLLLLYCDDAVVFAKSPEVYNLCFMISKHIVHNGAWKLTRRKQKQ